MNKSNSAYVLDFLNEEVPHSKLCLGSKINPLDCTCGLTNVIDKAEESLAIELSAEYTRDYITTNNIIVSLATKALSNGSESGGVLIGINAERALHLLEPWKNGKNGNNR
jgi:hypothetical protein